MARTKSTSSSASSTKQPTVAEMRDFYEKNKKRLDNFATADSAIRTLRDLTKTSTKTIKTFDKSTLRTYMRNIISNESNLRALSWFLYYRSQAYARLCNFNANMFCLDARSIIPSDYSLIKENNQDRILKSYMETLDIVERLRLQQEFFNIFLTCFVQDVFYGVAFYDETGFFIYPIPADYAKINGKYGTGDFSYELDCSYLRNHQELLEWYPDPFDTLYKQYLSTNEKWQQMPDEHAICLKFRAEDYETYLAPFAPIFNSIINLIDLEDIQAIADEQEIDKLLWVELETLSNTDEVDDWKVDPDLVITYLNRMIEEALPDYVTAAIMPGKIDTISFSDTTATDTSKVANATETVLNTAGGSEILNGATINNTYAFKMAAIQNTEYAISSLLPQCQSWVNRFIAYFISNPYKVKFFPISVYTKEDFKNSLLLAGQNGLSTKLAYNTLNGFSEYDTLALNFLEEDILGLSHKLVPFNTSYTQSGGSSDVDPTAGGAPEKDAGDLSDSGERSRNQ